MPDKGTPFGHPRIGPYREYPAWTCTLKKIWGKMDHGDTVVVDYE